MCRPRKGVKLEWSAVEPHRSSTKKPSRCSGPRPVSTREARGGASLAGRRGGASYAAHSRRKLALTSASLAELHRAPSAAIGSGTLRSPPTGDRMFPRYGRRRARPFRNTNTRPFAGSETLASPTSRQSLMGISRIVRKPEWPQASGKRCSNSTSETPTRSERSFERGAQRGRGPEQLRAALGVADGQEKDERSGGRIQAADGRPYPGAVSGDPAPDPRPHDQSPRPGARHDGGAERSHCLDRPRRVTVQITYPRQRRDRRRSSARPLSPSAMSGRGAREPGRLAGHRGHPCRPRRAWVSPICCWRGRSIALFLPAARSRLMVRPTSRRVSTRGSG
jgi:hypothetical protein